jgi:hypothetical protein
VRFGVLASQPKATQKLAITVEYPLYVLRFETERAMKFVTAQSTLVTLKPGLVGLGEVSKNTFFVTSFP